ncbi:MAG: tetratricopeptide repeat protein [bacterium]
MTCKLQFLSLTVLAVVLLGSGCAPQLDRIETSVQANRDEIARLQAENKLLLQEVQALASLLRLERETGDQSAALKVAKLTQVSGRLDQLMQKLDDNAEYMRNLSARVDLLVTRSGIPTLGEYRPPARGGDGAVELPEEGRTILEAADLDRSSGNTGLARLGYEEFLEKYGRTEAADDALYRLGDMDLADGEHASALERFDDLLARFPASEWVPAALFKSRECLLGLGREDEAAARARLLIENHPGSTEAAMLQADPESR